jgi:hypothetical protein
MLADALAEVHKSWVPELVLPYLQTHCSETCSDFFKINNPSPAKAKQTTQTPPKPRKPQHLFHANETCFTIAKIVETVLQGCYSQAVVEYLALMTADWVNVTQQWFEAGDHSTKHNNLENAIVFLWRTSKSLVVQAAKSAIDKSFVFKSGRFECFQLLFWFLFNYRLNSLSSLSLSL